MNALMLVSPTCLRHAARLAMAAAGAIALLALAALVPAARAQDVGLADRIPSDGPPWRIERAADIPSVLRTALQQADCRQDDTMLLTFPIEIFRPVAGSLPMAIAPCAGWRLIGRAFLFDREARGEPRALAFPVMAFPGKVSASETPGFLTWDPHSRTLVAVEGSDVCDGALTRHTYRHDRRRDGDDLNGFALVKVERSKLDCDVPEKWQTIWEADAPR
jgi:hypothetical protein